MVLQSDEYKLYTISYTRYNTKNVIAVGTTRVSTILPLIIIISSTHMYYTIHYLAK